MVAADARPNIFSEQQEQWLGDAMADLTEADIRPVRDVALNAHLQAIADRLLATLPPTKIKFRVMLIDSSEINGLSLAGGHIYITRKLAAAAKNDDELAAVIGHEIGHIASHQFAFETTADLKRLLGVTQVGDRADVYAKFEALMDARLKDKHPMKGEDEKQDEADRIGVYAVAAAGYRPNASAEFWNRVFFVGGKTGGRISDFFGITKPTEKRLRGMMTMAAALPAGCGGGSSEATADFTSWHAAVVANQAVAVTASGVTKEVKLTPPLRMDLDRLRFSRDGKRMLAQDEGGIVVLTRDPFAVSFRIDAENALAAQFSPASDKIIFNTPGLHTEEWGIVEKKLLSAHEIVTRDDCIQSKITPDGRTLVCVSFNEDGVNLSLSLIDVESGNVVWQKKEFFEPSFFFFLELMRAHAEKLDIDVLPSGFSADGNTLIIGPGYSKVAFDLRTRAPIKIGGVLKSEVTGAFAFLGNDRVIGVNASEPRRSGVYSFPGGRQLKETALPFYDLESVSGPGAQALVMTHDLKESGTGLLDVTTQAMTAVRRQALDAWEGTLLVEGGDGSLQLIPQAEADKAKAKRIELPLSPLGALRSVQMSEDGQYLALSTKSRAGVWEIATGKQVFLTRGYTNAVWGSNGTLYADYPKFQKTDRKIVQLTMVTKGMASAPYTIDDKTSLRFGMLMEWKPDGKKAVELIVHKAQDDAVLWSKVFPDGYPASTVSFGDGDLIFAYELNSNFAKERLKQNAALAQETSDLKKKDRVRLIELVSRDTGKTVGEMILDVPLNSDGIGGLNRAGDQVYVEGIDNRTTVYSLQTGRQIRQIPGYVAAIDAETNRVCFGNRRDEAIVYEAQGDEVAHVRTGAVLRYARFGPKATSLMLLTADQRVLTTDLTKREEKDADR